MIGGGDWASDRLIPDAVNAWKNNIPLLIRMPDAVRPWQHVLDPLYGYLSLCEALWHDPGLASAWNFGPPLNTSCSVRTIVEKARECFGRGEIQYGKALPSLHEAKYLKLDTTKIQKVLNINSRLNIDNAVSMTINWYRELFSGMDARELCLKDINSFEAIS